MSEHATPGPDTIMGTSGDDWLAGGAGADTIDGGAGMDWVSYYGSDVGVNVDLSPGGVNRGGHAEGDVLKNIENVYGSMHNDVVTGGISDNMLLGNQGDDMLAGGGGDDTLHGGMGNDELMGGRGDDMLMGGQGDDELMGGAGNDTIDGGMGADEIDGGDGMDWIRYAGSATGVTVDLMGTGSGGKAEGDTFMNVEGVIGSHMADKITLHDDGGMAYGYMGNDNLMGGDGNDMLGGGKGDDMLSGGGGDDTLKGGAGTDTFMVSGGMNKIADFASGERIMFGDDKLTSGQLDDVIASETMTDGYYMYTHDGTSVMTSGPLDRDDFYADDDPGTPPGGVDRTVFPLTNGDDFWPVGVRNSGHDHVRALDGDDDVAGGKGSDLLDGGEGDDLLAGEGDDDYLYGRAGEDTLRGGDDDDELYGGANNDTLEGGMHDDLLDGGSGDDLLYGGDLDEDADVVAAAMDGRDQLMGGDGNDTLHGGGDRDYLAGGDGVDSLYGGAGDDLLRADRRDGLIDGGADDDTVDFMGETAGQTVTLGIETGETVINVEHFKGGSGGDSVTVDGGRTEGSRIEGRDGNDTLVGGAGADDIKGGNGADDIAGGAGEDTLVGGAGNDTLRGGTEATVGAESDELTGGSGRDTFVWGDNDVVTDYARGDVIDHPTVVGAATSVDANYSMVDHDNNLDTPAALAVEVGGETMYFEGLDTTDTGDLVWT